MASHQETLDHILGLLRRQDFAGAGQLIEDTLRREPGFAEGRNALLAHWLVLAARWPLIDRLLPAGTNWLHSSGWLNSLFVGKPLNGQGAPVPWFTYPAIEFLEPRIAPTWRVFEWGSGFSTLWWAARVAEVRAVEHDAAWHHELSGRLPANARVELVTATAAYDAAIETAGGPFDVVVIDGEARNACAARALHHVKPDGLIVFDNSDRQAFRPGVEQLGLAGWKRIDFFGPIPAYLYKNCTSVFFRDDRFITGGPLPADVASSVGATCARALGE
jgi:hypothetical protein